MIGNLPTKLKINDTLYNIRSDFRPCILILEALNDRRLTDFDKIQILIKVLYKDVVLDGDLKEAYIKGIWFLNCGNTIDKPTSSRQLYSWEQDEQMLFSAINKVAGKEVRSLEYLHFWTFMGLFNEIGEGMFSTVLSIRNKKAKGVKLEKWERDFYKNNKTVIDLKLQLTEEEQKEINEVDNLLRPT